MNDEPICKICGHHGDNHRSAKPVACSACPDGVCQDGEAGERYRARLTKDSGSANVNDG